MTLIFQRNMTCTEDNHQKAYNVEMCRLDPEDLPDNHVEEYEVLGKFGRIGATLTQILKYRGTSFTRAEGVFDDLVAEKIRKGYRTVSTTATPAAPAMNHTVSTMNHTVSTIVTAPVSPAKVKRSKPSLPADNFYDTPARLITII